MPDPTVSAVINVLRQSYAARAGTTGLMPFDDLPQAFRAEWEHLAMHVVAAVERTQKPDLRRRLATALHNADCGCTDFGDPATDEDDRYIRAVDEALRKAGDA